MSEPKWINGDDFALGIDPRCGACDERHGEDSCGASEPDPDALYYELHEL